MHLAFSRDQPEKLYVTHLLEQNADELWDIIGVKNGHIYVCGYVLDLKVKLLNNLNRLFMIFYIFSDARSMAKDVHNIIVKVVMEKGQMTNSQAQNYVKKMEQQKRYSADVWS